MIQRLVKQDSAILWEKQEGSHNRKVCFNVTHLLSKRYVRKVRDSHSWIQLINLTRIVANEIISFPNLKQCLWKSYHISWKTPRKSIYDVWNIFKLSVGRYYIKMSSKSVKQNNIFFSWWLLWLENIISRRPRSFLSWGGRAWTIIQSNFSSKNNSKRMSVQDRYNTESGQKIKQNHSIREHMTCYKWHHLCYLYTMCTYSAHVWVCINKHVYIYMYICIFTYTDTYMRGRGEKMTINSLKAGNNIRKTAKKAPLWHHIGNISLANPLTHIPPLFAALCCLCLKWRHKEFRLTENFKEGEEVKLFLLSEKHQTKKNPQAGN